MTLPITHLGVDLGGRIKLTLGLEWVGMGFGVGWGAHGQIFGQLKEKNFVQSLFSKATDDDRNPAASGARVSQSPSRRPSMMDAPLNFLRTSLFEKMDDAEREQTTDAELTPLAGAEEEREGEDDEVGGAGVGGSF